MNIFYILYIHIEYLAFCIYQSLTCGGKGRGLGKEGFKLTDAFYAPLLQVYPTTMRALGMGTSGSLCRIGAVVEPFISQVQPRGLCREDMSKGGGERGTWLPSG